MKVEYYMDKHVQVFLESLGKKIDGYYHVPYWFKRVDGDDFEVLRFEDLPEKIKSRLEEERIL